MRTIFLILALAGNVLQALVILSLLGGAYRDFPLLLAYLIVLLSTSLLDLSGFTQIPTLIDYYNRFYWFHDGLRQIFLFTLVISLTYGALAGHPRRSQIRRGLIIGAIVVAFGSVLLAQDENYARWMSIVSRNLSVVAILANLVLWFALIRSKTRDVRLLIVSGSIGINMAGEAVGQSLRDISRVSQFTGNLVIVLSHIVCLVLLWRTFSVRDGAALLRERSSRI